MFHQIFAIQEATGRLVHAEEDYIASGLACGCLCSLCQGRLVAKKGEVRRPHFAHLGVAEPGKRTGGGCPYGHKDSEFDLKRFALRVLSELTTLRVPEWKGDWNGTEDFEAKARQLPIDPDSVAVGETIPLASGGALMPAILLTVKGRPLIVEIAIGRSAGSYQRDQLARAGIPAIEIALNSEMLREASYGEIRRALEQGANRTWLHHPAIAARTQRLRKANGFERARQQARNEECAKAIHEAETMVEFYNDMRDASPELRRARDAVENSGLSDLIGIETAGTAALGCPADLWQSVAILQVLQASDDAFIVPGQDLASRILERLRKIHTLPKKLDRRMRWIDLKEIHEDVPEYWTCWHAVNNYLRWLGRTGETRTISREDHTFELTGRLREAVGIVGRNETALREIEELLDKVMKAATPADRKKFNREAWLDSIDPRLRAGEAAKIAPGVINALLVKLRALERFLTKGYVHGDTGANLDLIGLPLRNTIQGRRRAAPKAHQRLERSRAFFEARDRRKITRKMTFAPAEVRRYSDDLQSAKAAIQRAFDIGSKQKGWGRYWTQTPQPEFGDRMPIEASMSPLSIGRRFLRFMAGKLPEAGIADPWPNLPIPDFEPELGEYVLFLREHEKA